jgi:hypothetical protein
VDKWPRARAGIEMYLDQDVRTVFQRHLGRPAASMEHAV